MSRSVITCRQCKEPIAYRRPGGNIQFEVKGYGRMVYRSDGTVEVRCSCGAVRVFRQVPKAA